MITRTSRKIVTFTHAFLLKGVDRILPPGDYPVITDEELIEGLSFSAYRRVSTMILVPMQSHRASSVEMVTIDPSDLQAAQDRDAATHQLLPTNVAAHSDWNRTIGHS
jgi:hypothetical protein